MHQVQGHFSFYLRTFKEPDNWSLILSQSTVLNVTNGGKYFEFCLIWDTATTEEISNYIACSADSMGFLLDIPMYYGYSMTPQNSITVAQLPSTSVNAIHFEYLNQSMEYDDTVKHYIDVQTPGESFIAAKDIENLIQRLHTDSALSGAIYHYLKALEEPEFFLASLYSAYELIRHSNAFSRKYFNGLTQLANATTVLGSRHTSAKVTSVRGLTALERRTCQEIMKKGILQYANTISI